MKSVTFLILFILIFSTGFLIFDLYAEDNSVAFQHGTLEKQQKEMAEDNLNHRLASLDDTEKIKALSHLLAWAKKCDQYLLGSIDSTHEITRLTVYVVSAFNFLIAVCVAYLTLQPNRKKTTAS